MHISAWREYELSKQARSDTGITAQQLRWLAALAGKTPENPQEVEAQQLASTALRKLQGSAAPGTLSQSTKHGLNVSREFQKAPQSGSTGSSHAHGSSYAFPAQQQYSRMRRGAGAASSSSAQATQAPSLTRQLHALSSGSRGGVSHVLAAPSSPSHALLDELYPGRMHRAAQAAQAGRGGWGGHTSNLRSRDVRSASRRTRGTTDGSAASVASAPDRLVAGGGAVRDRARGGTLGAAVPHWLKHSSFAAGATHGLQAQGRPKLRTSHAAAAARALSGGGVGQAFGGAEMGLPSAMRTGRPRHSYAGSSAGTSHGVGAGPKPSRPTAQGPAPGGGRGGSEAMLNDTQRRLQLYTAGATSHSAAVSPTSLPPNADTDSRAVPSAAAVAAPAQSGALTATQATAVASSAITAQSTVGGLPLSEATALLGMMAAQAERQESLSAALAAQAAETQALRAQLAALASSQATTGAASGTVAAQAPLPQAAATAHRSPPRSPVLSARELIGQQTAEAAQGSTQDTPGAEVAGSAAPPALTGVDRYLSLLGMGSARRDQPSPRATATATATATSTSSRMSATADAPGALHAASPVPTQQAVPASPPASPGDGGEDDIDGLLGWLAELPEEGDGGMQGL